jgi:hypothetical protein
VRNEFRPRVLLRILLFIDTLFHTFLPPWLIKIKRSTTLFGENYPLKKRLFRQWDDIQGKKCHNMDTSKKQQGVKIV